MKNLVIHKNVNYYKHSKGECSGQLEIKDIPIGKTHLYSFCCEKGMNLLLKDVSQEIANQGGFKGKSQANKIITKLLK